MRSGSVWRSATRDLVVEWRLGTIANRPARRFSATSRCTSWGTHPDQNSGEMPLDVTRRKQPVGARMLPWESDVADDGARQPQLPTGAGYQPSPSVGGLRTRWR